MDFWWTSDRPLVDVWWTSGGRLVDLWWTSGELLEDTQVDPLVDPNCTNGFSVLKLHHSLFFIFDARAIKERKK